MPYCLIFDTETTGLPKCKRGETPTANNIHLWPHIVQLSFIIYDTTNLHLVQVSDMLINIPETVNIPAECTAIHGITREMVREKGVSIQTALSLFMKMYEESEFIVAHNFSFDMNMVRAEINRLPHEQMAITRSKKKQYDAFMTSLNIGKTFEYCTMKMGKKFCNIIRTNSRGQYVKYPTLTELYEKRFGSPPQNMHNSLNDVIATLRCFLFDMFETDMMVYVQPELYQLLTKIS